MSEINNIQENMQNTQTNRSELQGRLRDQIEVRRLVRIGNPGAATMQSIINKARSDGYNKRSIMGDILDESILNIMKNDGNCIIEVHQDALGADKMGKFIVHDNIELGFKGLDEDGPTNPLCSITQKAARHMRNDEWSEHGQGFTSASMTACEQLTIISKFENANGEMVYGGVNCDWVDMARRNTRMPHAIPVSQEEYEEIHEFSNGSRIIYDRCRSEIFDTDMATEVKSIKDYISTVYRKALIEGGGKIDNMKVRLKVFNSQGEETEDTFINPMISPVDDDNHPHEKYEFRIFLRKNVGGQKKNIVKDMTTNTCFVWHNDGVDGSFKRINQSPLTTLENNFPIIEDTIIMTGTRTSGCQDYNDIGLPMGSVNLIRYGRCLTNDIRYGGRKLSFVHYAHNGEANYHYIEVEWLNKSISNKLKATNRKIIDGRLDEIRNDVVDACRFAQKKIRTHLGGETKFKRNWKRDHNDVEWDDELSYQENVEAAQVQEEDEDTESEGEETENEEEDEEEKQPEEEDEEEDDEDDEENDEELFDEFGVNIKAKNELRELYPNWNEERISLVASRPDLYFAYCDGDGVVLGDEEDVEEKQPEEEDEEEDVEEKQPEEEDEEEEDNNGPNFDTGSSTREPVEVAHSQSRNVTVKALEEIRDRPNTNDEIDGTIRADIKPVICEMLKSITSTANANVMILHSFGMVDNIDITNSINMLIGLYRNKYTENERVSGGTLIKALWDKIY